MPTPHICPHKWRRYKVLPTRHVFADQYLTLNARFTNQRFNDIVYVDKTNKLIAIATNGSRFQIQRFIHQKSKIVISTSSTFTIRYINHKTMDIDLICAYKHCKQIR